MNALAKRPARVRPRVLVVGLEEPDEGLSLMAMVTAGVPDASVLRVETRDALLALLAEERFDAVVVDCDLPGLHPMELTSVFAAAGPAPMLLVSWGVGEVAAVAALRAGARDWVLRSELPRVGAAVARVLADPAVAPPVADAFALLGEGLQLLTRAVGRLAPGERTLLAPPLDALRSAVASAKAVPARRARAAKE